MQSVSSYSYSSDTFSDSHHIHHRYDDTQDSQPLFSPVLQGLLLLSIVLAILLVVLFCSHPMTIQSLASDFQAGIDALSQWE